MTTRRDRAVREGLPPLLPRLRRFALVLTLNPADADDLVQAGIERALTRAALFNPEARLESWMFKIMQNMWIDQKRQKQRRGAHVDISEINSMAGSDGRKTVKINAMLNDIRSAVADLPDDQRAVFGLVLVEGESYRDAAEILNIPIGTVMSRLSRARQQVMGTIGWNTLADGELT